MFSNLSYIKIINCYSVNFIDSWDGKTGFCISIADKGTFNAHQSGLKDKSDLIRQTGYFII